MIERSPIHFSCLLGEKMIVSLTELAGCSEIFMKVDEKDIKGNTGLHLACQRGSFEIVEFLMTHGSSTEIENKNGQGPL